MDKFEDKYAPHIEDLDRALEGKIDRAELVRELRKYVKDYNIEVDLAKGSIVRKFFGDPSALSVSSERKLVEVGPNEPSVTFTGKILAVNEKTIGGPENPRIIHSGLIGDATKTIPFTAWNEFGFVKGDVLKVTNAYSREWQGEPQLNFGDRARIQKLEVADFEVVPFEREPTHKKVADFRAGQRNVVCTARIIEVEERQIEVKGEPRTLWSGRLGDNTGISRFTAWEDFDLKAGEAYTIANAYTREFRGIPELQLSTGTEITPAPEAKLPPLEELNQGVPMSIEALEQRGGGVDVTLSGFILEVREGSGLIFRCPECNRVLQSGACMIHDRQQGKPDLRTKAVLDDGTGSVQCILGRETTEEILGYTLDEALEKVKETYSPEVVQEELQDKLVLAPARITGNIVNDDWGLMMIGRAVTVEAAYDAEAEAMRFLDSLAADVEVA